MPLPYEKQEPRLAAALAAIYARGAVLRAYVWKRGIHTGVGRCPETPNHPPLVIEPDGTSAYLF